jgi:thymidine kinase
VARSPIGAATRLAESGKQVLLSGLDTGYMGRPFPPIPELPCLTESIAKTVAICVRCGNPARHAQRLAASEEPIVVGVAPSLLRSGGIETGDAGFRAASTASRAGTPGRRLSARMH